MIKEDQRCQRGIAMTEFLIVTPVLLLLGLGILQMMLLYNAKSTLNYATFEAARTGAVTHARVDKIRKELGLRLAPIFGGDGSVSSANDAILRSTIDTRDTRYTKIQIINPTRAAFDDFGIDTADSDVRELPNGHLRYRGKTIGESSGVNIQDANLLKIKVTYGYELKVPVIDRLLPAALALFNPGKKSYYDAGRLPIESVATVRMQSAAWLGGNGNVGEIDLGSGLLASNDPGSSQSPGGDASGNAGNSTEGQGGRDDVAGNDDPAPIDPNAGAGSSCNAASAPATQPGTLPDTEVGNPIHVVTGNKYQAEKDLRKLSGPLGLGFTRHYNSQSDYLGSMGHGWRHSYDLTLAYQSDHYLLTQADGRQMQFMSKEDNAYVSQRVADGWLQDNDGWVTWHWRDGRQLLFNPDRQLVSITTRSGLSTRLSYNAEKQLFLIRDPEGRQLTLSYYPNGRLKQFYDPAGNITGYRYNDEGNLVNVTDGDEHSREYHYDDPSDAHNLTGITDQRGIRFATWVYDAEDRAIASEHAGGVEKVTLDFSVAGQTTVTDSLGRISIYHTEIRNDVALVTRIDGPGCSSCGTGDVSYTYNEQLQLTSIARKNGITRHFLYDAQGRTLKIGERSNNTKRAIATYSYKGDSILPATVTEPSVNPDGYHQWQLRTNSADQVTAITEIGYTSDFKGGFRRVRKTTQYTYKDGKLATMNGPLPGDVDLVSYTRKHVIKNVERDAYGRPLFLKAGKNNPIAVTYTRNGLLQTVSASNDPATKIATLEYDAAGNLTGLTGPSGTVTATYDDAGRPVAVIAPDGKHSQWRWDTESQLTMRQTLDAQGKSQQRTVYNYDDKGLPKRIEDHRGRVTTYQYDAGGRLADLTDPLQHLQTYSYDAWGRTKSITRAANSNMAATTSFTYDVHGRKILHTDARGNSSYTQYDDFGQRMMQSTPDAGIKVYRYNARGQVIARVDESGLITRFDYDDRGRITGIGAFKHPANTTLAYANNRLASEKGINQTSDYQYDAKGRIVEKKVTLKGLPKPFVTQYQYDASGKLIGKSLPDGQAFNYRYTAAGQLRSIKRKGWINGLSVLEVMNYDVHGRLVSMTHGDSQKTEYQYDASGRLIRQDSKGLETIAYQYDLLDKQMGATRNGKSRHFTYDALDRLASASSLKSESTWTYDKAGNRTAQQLDGKQTAYQYATDSNRLLAVNDGTLKYTSTGQPVEKGKLRYEYTLGGRPSKVYRGDTLLAEYRYNSDGERIRKIDHSGTSPKTTYYLYDNKKLVAEINERGKITDQYLYIGHKPIAKLEGESLYSIHTDRRHSPIAMTDEQGDSVWKASYTAFGEAFLISEKTKLNLRLPGQYFDRETATHYNLYRDYDPKTGRYLTSDPLGVMAGDNTYAYVGNDPLNRVDPLGLYEEVVHYYMTYFLAVVAGIPEDQARVMALATQFVDDNSRTGPLDLAALLEINFSLAPFGPDVVGPLALYHFTLDYDSPYLYNGDTTDDRLTRFQNPTSIQLFRLLSASYNRQNSICTSTQLFGEYLHSLEDTYAHRDAENVPYQIGSGLENHPFGGIGHGGAGHSPDSTYNQTHEDEQWAYNELRTLEMEKDVFEEMITFSKRFGYINDVDDLFFDWESLAGDGTARIGLPGDAAGEDVVGYQPGSGLGGVLQEFNEFDEGAREEDIRRRYPDWSDEEVEYATMREKVAILDNFLNGIGRADIPVYEDENVDSEPEARINRDQNLDGLDLENYPGVIPDTERF